MLHSTIKVLSWRHRNEYGGVQQLVREWRLFGFKVWTTVLDEETIPPSAHIQLCALGYTDWQSKFSEYI